jgi:hypothetical protein
MLTIEEAARVVRIGRSAAYQLAREYLATDGSSGIPVMRIGGQLRVPRHMLEGYIGGPITWPIPDATVDDARVDEIATGTSEAVTLAEPIHLAGRRATRRNGSQLALGLDP